MELRGLADFQLALTDDTGKIITDPDTGLGASGIFKVDLNSSKGSTQANVSGLAPTVTKVYGSNAVAEQTVGVESPSIALAANDIPHIITDKIEGLVTQATDGGHGKTAGSVVYGSLLIHSDNGQLGDNKVDAYLAFPLGVITMGNLDLQTNGASPVVVHDALTFAAQARPSDNLIYEWFYSDDTNFDEQKMLAGVFNGYTAPAGSGTQSTATTPASTGTGSSK